MENEVSQSRFNMWRTLFALTHADGVVTSEEISFMRKALEKVPFSQAQLDLLCTEMAMAQDIYILFEQITDASDQMDFFSLAREVVYADGDYGQEEQTVLIELQKRQSKKVDPAKMAGSVTLELEEPSPRMQRTPAAP